VWTGVKWNTEWSRGRLLCTLYWNFGVHNNRGNCWIASRLSASEEGLSWLLVFICTDNYSLLFSKIKRKYLPDLSCGLLDCDIIGYLRFGGPCCHHLYAPKRRNPTASLRGVISQKTTNRIFFIDVETSNFVSRISSWYSTWRYELICNTNLASNEMMVTYRELEGVGEEWVVVYSCYYRLKRLRKIRKSSMWLRLAPTENRTWYC